MEQKSYNLEIVLELAKNKSHIREIAKNLKTNHMLVFRKLKELYSENVVDFKNEGKNKVFFLKKTSEARAYIFMAEQYKLVKILKKYPLLRKIVEKIQENEKIKLAVLFGSYAKELAKADSDIDIYIETEDSRLKKEIELIDSKINLKIGKFDKGNLLIKEIIKNHVIIKGFEEFNEKNKFFEQA